MGIKEECEILELQEALSNVRDNLISIDVTGDPGVDSYVDDSIGIINKALEGGGNE